MKPFLNRMKAYPGKKDFDKYYIHQIVKPVYKPVPGTEKKDDKGNIIPNTGSFTQTNEIIIDKVDIRKSINAQASQVGIDAFLKPYLVAGTEPPGVSVGDGVQDFSDMPETLAEVADLGKSALDKFKSLDPKLTKGRNFNDFLSTLSDAELTEYFKSLIYKKKPKENSKEKDKPKEGDDK